MKSELVYQKPLQNHLNMKRWGITRLSGAPAGGALANSCPTGNLARVHIIKTPLEASLKVHQATCIQVKTPAQGVTLLKIVQEQKVQQSIGGARENCAPQKQQQLQAGVKLVKYREVSFVLEQSLLVYLLLKWHLQRFDKWGW